MTLWRVYTLINSNIKESSYEQETIYTACYRGRASQYDAGATGRVNGQR